MCNLYICHAGEWWNQDVETIVSQANKLGLPPQTSDAHTINGKPGPLFPCSEKCKNPSPDFEKHFCFRLFLFSVFVFLVFGNKPMKNSKKLTVFITVIVVRKQVPKTLKNMLFYGSCKTVVFRNSSPNKFSIFSKKNGKQKL